jgi:hypothetical protein
MASVDATGATDLVATDDDDRIGEESPATLPDDEDASDQSATAPVVPGESVAIG